MLTTLSWLSLASASVVVPVAPEPAPFDVYANLGVENQVLARRAEEVIRPQEVRSLPGELNEIPIFNSNSPELIQEEGILLSTLPPDNMAAEDAHLNFPFKGDFAFFAHHIARGQRHDDRRTLFLGAVVYNPNSTPVTLEIQQGVSYLSQEAPFRRLPSLVANPRGSVFAGPGSRTVTDILQGRNQSQWPERVTIPGRRAYLLLNAPIPLRQLPFAVDATLPPGSVLPPMPAVEITDTVLAADQPPATNRPLPSNGRSALLYLSSSDTVHVASMAMYAPRTYRGQERAPTLQEWLSLLVNGDLAGPRDRPPTDPDTFRKLLRNERFIYGRVAGVTQGTQWSSQLTDEPGGDTLTIPEPGESLSYVISTVDHNTFGTTQIQSAPMLARYDDTAYRGHGNYGVHYALTLPLRNSSAVRRQVLLKLQTPIQDESLTSGLRFSQPPAERVFFRGTVRLRYKSPLGIEQSRYVHVVQRQGQEGEPLLELTLPPGAGQTVEVDFIYPPDATPPQVLTVTTLDRANFFGAVNGTSSD